MDKNTFELGDNDAAIIFKQDMSTEIMLPNMGDDETIDFEKHQNIFVAIAISGSMGDDDFRKVIGAKLDTMFNKADEMKAADEDTSSVCPSSGCAGCDVKHEEDPGE